MAQETARQAAQEVVNKWAAVGDISQELQKARTFAELVTKVNVLSQSVREPDLQDKLKRDKLRLNGLKAHFDQPGVDLSNLRGERLQTMMDLVLKVKAEIETVEVSQRLNEVLGLLQKS